MVDEAAERWDSDLAQWLVGKYVLVGIKYFDPITSELASQVQIHGTIKTADRSSAIVLECSGKRKGELFSLPPDTAVFGPGQKGIYKLHSTGEEVDSPDAVATWEVGKHTEVERE